MHKSSIICAGMFYKKVKPKDAPSFEDFLFYYFIKQNFYKKVS
jgi:hypothetical protein